MVELPIHTEYLQLGSDDVDLYGTRSQSSDLHPVVVDAWVHGGTTRPHCVGIEVLLTSHLMMELKVSSWTP